MFACRIPDDFPLHILLHISMVVAFALIYHEVGRSKVKRSEQAALDALDIRGSFYLSILVHGGLALEERIDEWDLGEVVVAHLILSKLAMLYTLVCLLRSGGCRKRRR